jgi:hypothetical protein
MRRHYADAVRFFSGMIDIEKLLVDVGAVKLGDSRLQRKKEGEDEASNKIRQGKTAAADDDDSDWD